MSEQQSETKPSIYPGLRYVDAPAAVEWLCRAFGFEQHLVVPNPDGTIAHAELRFGNGMVMLGSAREDSLGMKTAGEAGYVTQSIYVYAPNVDAHHARAMGAGATIVREIDDTDYGSREYSCRDLEGNLWSFGTYLP